MATIKKTVKAAEAKVVKTVAELQADLAKLRQDHQDARRSHRQGELVNPHVLTTHRKAIARTMTQINQARKDQDAAKEAK